MKSFQLTFVPHLPPVPFTIQAKDWQSAVKKAERQIRNGKGPAVTHNPRKIDRPDCPPVPVPNQNVIE